jgi:hypothetical protein
VVLAVPPYRVVVDAFAGTPTPISVTSSDGATPITQVLTTTGRWEIGAGSLTFTPEGGSPQVVLQADGLRRVAGLAFTAGRVVAVGIVDGGDNPVLEVGVFDADSAQLISTGAPVGVDGSTAAADAGEASPAESEQSGEGAL